MANQSANGCKKVAQDGIGKGTDSILGYDPVIVDKGKWTKLWFCELWQYGNIAIWLPSKRMIHPPKKRSTKEPNTWHDKGATFSVQHLGVSKSIDKKRNKNEIPSKILDLIQTFFLGK